MPLAHRGSVAIAWRDESAAGPDADPVLLVMGLSGSGRTWARLLPHLRSELRPIVFDNRGTGGSSQVRGPLSMNDMVEDAVAVLDDAGIERAHVVGVSMGGMIAQMLALDHRARVASLVLGCTTAGGPSGPPPWRLLTSVALRPLGPRRTWPLVVPALYARRTREQHPERIAEDLEIRVSDETPLATTLGQLGAILGFDARRRLSEMAGLPTLVLHGEEDGLIPLSRGEDLARRIPGARLVTLPETGHMLATDAEQGTADAVLDHLTTHAFKAARAPAGGSSPNGRA